MTLAMTLGDDRAAIGRSIGADSRLQTPKCAPPLTQSGHLHALRDQRKKLLNTDFYTTNPTERTR